MSRGVHRRCHAGKTKIKEGGPVKLFLALSGVLMAGCSTTVTKPVLQPSSIHAAHPFITQDLRDPKWRATTITPHVKGIVQQRGDDAIIGGTPNYLWTHLQQTLLSRGAKHVQLKTADWRVALLDLSVPVLGPNTMGIDQIHHVLTAESSASAVVCISVDGVDYLGNHVRSFRSAPEPEALVALSEAVWALRANIENGMPSNSPACEPGWEGGQPRRQD